MLFHFSCLLYGESESRREGTPERVLGILALALPLKSWLPLVLVVFPSFSSC